MKADYSYLREGEKYGPHLPTTTAQDVEHNIREAEAEGVRVLTAFGVWDAAASRPKWELFYPLEAEIEQVRDAWLAVQGAMTLTALLNKYPDALKMVWATMQMDSHYYATICFPHMRNAIAKPDGKRKESVFRKPVFEAVKTHRSGSLYSTVETYLKNEYGVTKDVVGEGQNPESAILRMGKNKITVSSLRRKIKEWSRV